MEGVAAPPPTLLLLAGLLGLCIGSFLNVCIHRLPRGESILHPPSHCPRCSTPLRWFQNIPVISWLLLGRRCATCRAPIAFRYPAVELATALLWIAVVMLTPLGWLLASRLVLVTMLIVLFLIDLEHHLLPNVITLPGIVLGFVFSWLAPPGPLDSMIGILVGGGLLYATAAAYYMWRREEGMGMGDVKMLAMVGAFLGWRGALLTVVLSSLVGAVVGGLLLFTSRGSMRYALPFGTFLSLAALVAMIFGDGLIDWYLGFYPDR